MKSFIEPTSDGTLGSNPSYAYTENLMIFKPNHSSKKLYFIMINDSRQDLKISFTEKMSYDDAKSLQVDFGPIPTAVS